MKTNFRFLFNWLFMKIIGVIEALLNNLSISFESSNLEIEMTFS